MNTVRGNSLFIILAVFILSSGCSEEKGLQQTVAATPMPTQSSADPPDQRATAQPSEAIVKMELTAPVSTTVVIPQVNPVEENHNASVKSGNQQPTSANDTTKFTLEPKDHFRDAIYFPNDMVGLVVAHPRQFCESAIGKLLTDFTFEQEIPYVGEFVRRANLKPVDIERLTIVVDRSLMNSLASRFGLRVATPLVAETARLKNSLKQLGLGFHSYHDTFNKFPRADGDGDGKHTGLSWRVHLLPFIDQGQLYNQFRFNEPWDGEHNRKLIAQMPAVFETPGVDEAGKTSFHVLTGEKTAFHGEQGLSLREITELSLKKSHPIFRRRLPPLQANPGVSFCVRARFFRIRSTSASHNAWTKNNRLISFRRLLPAAARTALIASPRKPRRKQRPMR